MLWYDMYMMKCYVKSMATIRQTKYRYVLHNAAVTVTNSNGRPTKVELSEKARPIGKGAQ